MAAFASFIGSLRLQLLKQRFPVSSENLARDDPSLHAGHSEPFVKTKRITKAKHRLDPIGRCPGFRWAAVGSKSRTLGSSRVLPTYALRGLQGICGPSFLVLFVTFRNVRLVAPKPSFLFFAFHHSSSCLILQPLPRMHSILRRMGVRA